MSIVDDHINEVFKGRGDQYAQTPDEQIAQIMAESRSQQTQPRQPTYDDWVIDELRAKMAPPPAPEEPGYGEVIGKGMMRGVQGMAGGVGSAVRWAGEVGGDPTLARLGDEASDYWEKAQSEGTFKRDPNLYRGSFMENPSFKRAFGHMSEGAPSFAASLVTGGTAMGLGLGVKGAAWVSGITLGLMEGAPQYEEAREAGKSIEEASRYGAASTVGTAVLERVGIGTFLKMFKKPVKETAEEVIKQAGGKTTIKSFIAKNTLPQRVVKGFAVEGLQEGSQTLWQNAVAKYGYKPTQDLAEGIVESMIAGAGIGAVGGAAMPSAKTSAQKLDRAIRRMKKKGATDEDIDKLKQDLINNINKKGETEVPDETAAGIDNELNPPPPTDEDIPPNIPPTEPPPPPADDVEATAQDADPIIDQANDDFDVMMGDMGLGEPPTDMGMMPGADDLLDAEAEMQAEPEVEKAVLEDSRVIGGSTFEIYSTPSGGSIVRVYTPDGERLSNIEFDDFESGFKEYAQWVEEEQALVDEEDEGAGEPDVPEKSDRERSKEATERGELTYGKLSEEVKEFKGTGGIASENIEKGFSAAFRHKETGEVFEAKDENGKVTKVHLLGGIPEQYVTEKNKHGEPMAVSSDIESGFIKDGKFYTRSEAVAEISADETPDIEGAAEPDAPSKWHMDNLFNPNAPKVLADTATKRDVENHIGDIQTLIDRYNELKTESARKNLLTPQGWVGVNELTAAFELHKDRLSKFDDTPESPPADIGTKDNINVPALANLFLEKIRSGEKGLDKVKLKQFVAEQLGVKASELNLKNKYAHKPVEEAFEYALVKRSREIIAEGKSQEETYAALKEMYDSQPNLGTRSGGSKARQAYSTPAHMAFLAQEFAGVTNETTNFEITAGNGMLVTKADPVKTLVNEIDDLRNANLQDQGFATLNEDATTMSVVPVHDSVVANPPFGKAPSSVQINGFTLNKIDHVLAAKALQGMKDDGKGAIIIGGKHFTKTGEISPDNLAFLNWLYRHYNVVANIEIPAEAYTRQGANYPTRMIAVNGRKKTPKGLAPPIGKAYIKVKSIDDVLPILKEVQNGKQAVGPAASEKVPKSEDGAGGGTSGVGPGATGPDDVRPPIRPEGDKPDREGPGLAGEPGDGAGTGGVSGSGRGGQPGNRAGDDGQRRPVGESESGDDAVSPGTSEDTGSEGTTEPGTGKPGTGKREGVSEGDGRSDTTGVPGDDVNSDIDEAQKYLDSFFDTEETAETAETQDQPSEKPITQQTPQEYKRKPAPRTFKSWMRERSKRHKRKRRKRPSEQLSPPLNPPLDPTEALRGDDRIDKGINTIINGFAGSGVTELSMGKAPINESFYEKTLKPGFIDIWEGLKDKYFDLLERAKAFFDDVVPKLINSIGAKVRPYIQKFFETNIKRDMRQAAEEDAKNPFQTPYKPKSKGPIIDATLVPRRMKEALEKALNKLEKEVGDIDIYVKDKLEYETSEDMFNALSADQIDATALAINNLDKGSGMIIGDQTGVGKGRVAAALYRYAKLNDTLPIFFTAKPDLFTDFYRDIVDIGQEAFSPYLMASDETKGGIVDANGRLVQRVLKPRKRKEFMDAVEIGGKDSLAMAPYDGALATYSQVNKENRQQRPVLLELFPDSITILDEAHKASGDSNTGDFMRNAIRSPQGVIYLSATFAKNPKNMGVYHRTDLSRANLSLPELIAAVERGGVALQEVLSNALAEMGQMVRREKSFSGINVGSHVSTETKSRDVEHADAMTSGMRRIFDFDRAFMRAFKREVATALTAAANSGNTSGYLTVWGVRIPYRGVDDKGRPNQSVTKTDFGAIAHNAVRQLLFCMKCKNGAAKAIEAINERSHVAPHPKAKDRFMIVNEDGRIIMGEDPDKALTKWQADMNVAPNGRKPVIAFDNTMESFYKYMLDIGELKMGEVFSPSFNMVLKKNLFNTLKVSYRNPENPRQRVQVWIKKENLPQRIRSMYEQVERHIATIGDDLPGNPVDIIHQEFVRADLNLGEISGRKLVSDFSDGADSPFLSERAPKVIADKKKVLRRFNSGALDGLLVNRSAAEGVSAHASPHFKDKRPRILISVQPQMNVDDEMQIYGRINRKGQVILPSYLTLYADLPAEIRPASVLAKKMKSLSANTSANADSPLAQKTLPDMMNKYGNQVTRRWIAENHDLAASLGIQAQDDFQKVSGRIAMQLVQIQREFFEDVEDDFRTLVAEKIERGEYDLETQEIDFKGRKGGSMVMTVGRDETHPLSGSTHMVEFNVKNPKKPLKRSEVVSRVEQTLDGRSSEAVFAPVVAQIKRQTAEYIERKEAAALEEERAYDSSFVDDALLITETYYDTYKVGHTYQIIIEDMPMITGVLTDIKHDNVTTGNPSKLSSSRFVFAVNNPMRTMSISFATVSRDEVRFFHRHNTIRDDWDTMARGTQRTNRHIVTGNLIQGFADVPDSARFIRFSDDKGVWQDGILMPETFDPSGPDAITGVVRVTPEIATKVLENGEQIENNLLTIKPDGQVDIESSRSGGLLYGDSRLQGLTRLGDFETVSGKMRGFIREGKIGEFLDIVYELGETISVPRRFYDEVVGDNTDNTTELSKGKKARQVDRTDAELDQLKKDIDGWLKEVLPPAAYRRVKKQLASRINVESEAIKESVEQWKKMGKEGGEIMGAATVDDMKALITLAYNYDNNTLQSNAYHEAFHVVTKWLLPEADLKKLHDYFGGEEAAAVAFQKFAMGKRVKKNSLIRRIFRMLKRAFQAIRSGLQGHGYNSPQDVFQKIMNQEYEMLPLAERLKRVNKDATLAKAKAENDTFVLRETPPPKKPLPGYKALRVKNGKLYTMMIGKNDMPMGSWLDGIVGGKPGKTTKTGRRRIKGRTQELGYRPGMHGGDLPFFPQGGGSKDPLYDKNNPTPEHPYAYILDDDVVIAEVDFDGDYEFSKEYEETAVRKKDGEINHAQSGLPYIPKANDLNNPTGKGGYYTYTTNTINRKRGLGLWLISGSMKIKRIMTREQVDQRMKEAGLPPQLWKNPDVPLESLGLKEWQWTTGKDPNSTIEFSMGEAVTEDTLWSHKTIGQLIKNRKLTKKQKKDLSFWDVILSTPMQAYAKIPAMKRMFDWAAKRTDRFQELFTDLTTTMNKDEEKVNNVVTIREFKKHQKKNAERLDKYLKGNDQNLIGYSVKLVGDQHVLKNPKGEEVGKFNSEDAAWADARKREAQDYKKKFPDATTEEIKALLAFRNIADNGFKLLMSNMRQLIEQFAGTGTELPTETVWREGKKIEINLKQALAEMGDRRGYFFPRIWKSGQFIAYARKKGKNPKLKKFDTRTMMAEWKTRMQRQGWSVETDQNTALGEDVFEALGQTASIQQIVQKAMEQAQGKDFTLKDFGLDAVDRKKGNQRDFMVRGTISKQQSEVMKNMGGRYFPSEGKTGPKVWHFANPGRNFEKRLAMTLSNVSDMVNMEAQTLFAKSLTEQVANVIKARGARVHMIKRKDAVGEDVWEGYEEDSLIAITKYAQGLAAGEAKKESALGMMRAFTGTDISFREFQEMEGDDATFEDFNKFVKKRGIDAGSQKVAFKDGMNYMKHVLRNDERIDRVMGVIKGAAVLKYLAGRVSAPIVNLTALATSVPAAMSAETGVPIHRTFKFLGKAMRDYHTWRWGDPKSLPAETRAVFEEIHRKGWHKAQYNEEALNVLKSRVGKGWDNAIEWSMMGFGATEQLNRIATIAGAAMAIQKTNPAATQKEVLERAKKVSDHSHALYGDFNDPTFARGSGVGSHVAKSFYMFKRFSHNYMLTMKELWGDSWNPKHGKAFSYMALSPAVLAGAGGFVGMPLVKLIAKALTDSDDPEEDWYDWLNNNVGSYAENLARNGVFGLAGINIRGSLDLGITDLPTNFKELMGAPGSMIADTFYHGPKDLMAGDIGKGIEKMLPMNALAAPLKAYRETSEGITTRGNAPIFFGSEPVKASMTAAIIRGLSFNPTEVSDVRERLWHERQVEQHYADERDVIRKRLKRFYLDPGNIDKADYIDWLTDVRAYNMKVIKHEKVGIIPIIDGKWMRNTLLRAFKPTRKELRKRAQMKRNN